MPYYDYSQPNYNWARRVNGCDIDDDLDEEYDFSGKRLWSETFYMELTVERDTVRAAFLKYEEAEIIRGRYDLQLTLERVAQHLAERIDSGHRPLSMQSPTYSKRDTEGRHWQLLRFGATLGEIMEGYTRRLIKVECRTTTTKRVIEALDLVQVEAEWEDEPDDMEPYSAQYLSEECDIYRLEFERDDNLLRHDKFLVRVRLRSASHCAPEEVKPDPDEYMAFRPDRLVHHMLSAVCCLNRIPYYRQEHAVLLRDGSGSRIRTYNRLDAWWNDDWTEAYIDAYIRREEYQ